MQLQLSNKTAGVFRFKEVMSEKVIAVYEIAVTSPEFQAVEYIEASKFSDAKEYAQTKYGADALTEFCTKRKVPADIVLPRTVPKPDCKVATLGAYRRGEE